MKDKYDVVIIGSGLAGLSCALSIDSNKSVLIITKSSASNSASNLAQGGVAAVIDDTDSISLHVKDTLHAGSHHNTVESVEKMSSESFDAINWLSSCGVQFKKSGGKYSLSLEAAHSKPRIVHTSDFTGQDIISALYSMLAKHSNITLIDDTFASNIIIKDNACVGVYIIDSTGEKEIWASDIVLATGGSGQVYKWTTNPTVATGDGLAMAIRAKADVCDAEFVQFHPTALQYGQSPLFLLSERLRGEGAHIIDEQGNRFTNELAPRDVLSRAIFEKQKNFTVFLTMKHVDRKTIQSNFPNIYHSLLERGFDLTVDPIPITPAAHYMCGGVKTNLLGQTSIQNLYAAGEVAATGVHGANRLASNSLLEAVVFARETAKHINKKTPTHSYKKTDSHTITTKDGVEKVSNEYIAFIHNYQTRIKKIMWEDVGIIRTTKGLKSAKDQLEKIMAEIKGKDTNLINYIELENILTVAYTITCAAYSRLKSLGAHHRLD